MAVLGVVMDGSQRSTWSIFRVLETSSIGWAFAIVVKIDQKNKVVV